MSQAKETVKGMVGWGAAEAKLSGDELREIVGQALQVVPRNSRVLAIIPDKTRDDNTDILFPFAAEVLQTRRVAVFDALVAQGTHAAMTTEEKLTKIGGRDKPLARCFGQVFDHHWDIASELTTLGELDARKVSELTDGLLNRPITLTANKLLRPDVYDTILIFGATVPHEVAGFAGGAKYFFPGVSGAELTHATHWLGALHGVEQTIGRIETPVRRMIEAAAEFVPAEIISFNSVVSRSEHDDLNTHALFAGDVRECFRQAARISARVHIKYTNRKYRRVVALLDEHYDEMWTGGKASYRLGAIVEEDGELIIYAPHLRCISDTHGRAIERYGYQPLESVRRLVAEGSGELDGNLCVAAHLAHVAYAGHSLDATKPRFKITLASQVDKEMCERVRLGYMNPRDFNLRDYQNDDETLIVERAGRDLYLVAPHEELPRV